MPLKAKKATSSDPLKDYVPPHSLEAEQSTLGAVLIERIAYDKAASILSPGDFYRDAHNTIYEVVGSMYDSNTPVDLMTLPYELKQRGIFEQVGGESYIVALYDAVPSAANVEYYARIVKDKALLRNVAEAAMQMIGLVRGPNAAEDVLDSCDSILAKVNEQVTTKKNYSAIYPVAYAEFEAIEKRQESKGQLSGLESGFGDLDDKTDGIMNDEFMILAARPSVGKTALMMTWAEFLSVTKKIPVGIISREMGERALTRRMLSAGSFVPSKAMRRGTMSQTDWVSLSHYMETVHDAPLYICEKGAEDIGGLRRVARSMQRNEGIKALFVDYLQLVAGTESSRGNRVLEMGDVAQGLKDFAKDTGVPVICLSQLNRSVESRADKRPTMSDLYESGKVEAIADIIGMLYREDYYNAQKGEAVAEIQETELILSKHRNGETGVVRLGFSTTQQKFVNYFPTEPTG